MSLWCVVKLKANNELLGVLASLTCFFFTAKHSGAAGRYQMLVNMTIKRPAVRREETAAQCERDSGLNLVALMPSCRCTKDPADWQIPGGSHSEITAWLGHWWDGSDPQIHLLVYTLSRLISPVTLLAASLQTDSGFYCTSFCFVLVLNKFVVRVGPVAFAAVQLVESCCALLI